MNRVAEDGAASQDVVAAGQAAATAARQPGATEASVMAAGVQAALAGEVPGVTQAAVQAAGRYAALAANEPDATEQSIAAAGSAAAQAALIPGATEESIARASQVVANAAKKGEIKSIVTKSKVTVTSDDGVDMICTEFLVEYESTLRTSLASSNRVIVSLSTDCEAEVNRRRLAETSIKMGSKIEYAEDSETPVTDKKVEDLLNEVDSDLASDLGVTIQTIEVKPGVDFSGASSVSAFIGLSFLSYMVL
jgi:hypothetical protein